MRIHLEEFDPSSPANVLKQHAGANLNRDENEDQRHAVHQTLQDLAQRTNGLTKSEADWLREHRTSTDQDVQLQKLMELVQMQHKGDDLQSRIEGADRKREYEDKFRLNALRTTNADIEQSIRDLLYSLEVDNIDNETISADMASKIEAVLKQEWVATRQIRTGDEPMSWSGFRKELGQMEPASLEILAKVIQEEIEKLEKTKDLEQAANETAIFLHNWQQVELNLQPLERHSLQIYRVQDLIDYCRKLASQTEDPRKFGSESEEKLGDFAEISNPENENYVKQVIYEALAALEQFKSELQNLLPQPKKYLKAISWVRNMNKLLARMGGTVFVTPGVLRFIEEKAEYSQFEWSSIAQYFDQPIEFLRRLRDTYEHLAGSHETREQIKSHLRLRNLKKCAETVRLTLNLPPQKSEMATIRGGSTPSADPTEAKLTQQ